MIPDAASGQSGRQATRKQTLRLVGTMPPELHPDRQTL